MEQEMRVSVICNVFNHAPYLRDALDGFVNQQTDFPFEVLVHDDASTDGSQDIIREYEEKYPDIIKPIYQTENQYSKGIKITLEYQKPRVKGKYVAICEGDDYWTDPLKLQKQSDFLEAHPDYSMCVNTTIWENMLNKRKLDRFHADEDMDISLEEIIVEKHGRIFQLASVMIRTEIWKQYPAWRLAFPIGDYPLALLAALNGKVRMLADPMTVYRWYSAGSWTSRMDDDARRVQISHKMIEGLNQFNEATNHRYEDVIAQRIHRHKYILAVMSHDLDTVRSEELRDIYGARKWYYHLAVYIHCKFPKFYTRWIKPIIRHVHGEG